MSAGSGSTDAAELADLALEVAREAAELVRRHAERGVSVAATKTSGTDVVTAADRASEELVRSRLLARRPHDGVLGEEGDDVVGTSGVRWVVDPIDGTVNFLYGIPQYAVSIAAELDGAAVAGVVLDVPKRREYVVRPEAGVDGHELVARRDGERIAVRGPAPLTERLVGTGFSYEASVRARQGAAVAHLLPRVRDVRRLGSCALDICAVAEGSLDGYIEEAVHPWDHAAAALIATAAGARVEIGLGASGHDVLLCAPDHGFGELRDLTVEAGFWAPQGSEARLVGRRRPPE